MSEIVELKSRKKDFVAFEVRVGSESTNHGVDTAMSLGRHQERHCLYILSPVDM